MPAGLSLRFDLEFQALYRRDGLARLDRCFVEALRERDVALHNRLVTARAAPETISGKAESELLVALAPTVEDFIGELFGIEAELAALLGVPVDVVSVGGLKDRDQHIREEAVVVA